MSKKLLVFVLAVAVGFTFFGCAKVAETTQSGGGGGNPTTLPAGTTAVRLAASNIQCSGNNMTLSMSALNQNNNVVSGLTTGNFTGGIYSSNPSISSVTAATTLSAVATITFTAISGGGGSGVASRDVSAALVIDKSGSMWTDKLVSAEIAGKMFVDQMATGPNNNCAVVLFDDHVSVEASMRNAAANKQSLIDAVTTEAAYGGSTALYYAIANGIWEASKEAASATRVRAVVALTDGGENASPYPYSGTSTGTIELVNQAVAAGIPVYTVGLYMSSSEASYYAPYLKSIALGTTGSESNYFEVIVGVTGLSAQRARALGVLTDLYTQLFTGLSQSYSMTSQISSSLTAGQTYWLLITFTAPVQGGSTITQTLVIPFIAH